MATPKTNEPAFDVITEDEIRKSPRGRKATFNPDLLSVLKNVGPGQAIRLRMFGEVVSTADRQKVGAEIRKHFSEVHPGRKCRVNYDPTTNYPQVQLVPQGS